MSIELHSTSVTHANIRRLKHPRLGVDVDGRTCVRVLRFRRRVRIDRLELFRRIRSSGRYMLPGHPAHIVVSVLDGHRWRTVKEFDLPRDPLIAGDGIEPEHLPADFHQRLEAICAIPLILPLENLETDHLRVECDREHPVIPCHDEFGQGADGYAVPFGILSPMSAYGEELESAPDTAIYRQPLLTPGKVEPSAPTGMKVRRHLTDIIFTGKHLSVGFSLRRPLLTHLGWDSEGFGQAGRNRLVTRRLDIYMARCEAAGASGPLVKTTAIDCGASHWTGEVAVAGNRVTYRNLRCAAGVRMDATFTVEPRRILLELVQSAESDLPVLEAEAWRFAWELRKGMTATAGVPTRREIRAGDVEFPALFAGDDGGCLSCNLLEGPADAVRLQAESYRGQAGGYQSGGVTTAGIVLGSLPAPGAPLVVSRAPVRALIELAVEPVRPVSTGGRGSRLSPAIRRHWPSVLSTFRAEYGGFSNHAASSNCHVNQHGCIDIAVFTARPEKGPAPIDLARFTIERAMLDGSGYGYCRNLYLDSDPVLLSSAGRIHQAEPDSAWLARMRPGLVETAERILGTIGEEGLAVCRELSGNSWTPGEPPRGFGSSNAWDQVGFGHMDAYSNTWTYRALRNGAALLRATGDRDLARRCREAADTMRRQFAKFLVNPETGLVVGWRSRDGALHDAAYLEINGLACAFGLLDRSAARRALGGLEALRQKLGLDEAPFGLPVNLLPIPEGDQPRYVSIFASASQLELFCNGSMVPGATAYYLRALSTNGFKASARKLARDMAAGFLCGAVTPGLAEGAEFFSWEGFASGYEGTFGPNFGALYAIAIEQGVFAPPDPEWWPAEGQD